ncbi:hypothetical protein [Pacificibacter sp. AS14]|uniref:hypothetical protein n=1 Tax=Pacificibacter sp. AS14 TaxID=3135785 RepID=UPI0031805257
MQISGAGSGYSGPPRLVDVRPETLSVNGISVSEDGMITALKGLIDTADDIVIIRPRHLLRFRTARPMETSSYMSTQMG